MAYLRKLQKPKGSGAGTQTYYRYAKEMQFCKDSSLESERLKAKLNLNNNLKLCYLSLH